ncbi:hypothetical protein PV-S19_0274 [Pacmanvirus S19]|nr:hypothetical protein PV-S19_0274 [Pacmanvirus S19]
MDSLLQRCVKHLTEIELLYLCEYEISSEIVYKSLQKRRMIDINNLCKNSHFKHSVFLDKLGKNCIQRINLSNIVKDVRRVLPPKVIIGGKHIYKHSLKYNVNNELIIVMRIMKNKPPIIAFHDKKWDRYECIELADNIKYLYIYTYFDVDTRVPSTYMSQPFVDEKDWEKLTRI